MSEKIKYTGLTDAEVVDSRLRDGWNILTPPKKTPLWKLYLEKYQDPIIQILLVAAVISLVMAAIEGEYVETIGIFIAIFLATTVGFIFELDAAKKFDVLTQLNEDQMVKVIRNGIVTTIKRKDVVVGDTVIVETGDEIPADGILNEANSLQVDESMLTGEPITTKCCPSQFSHDVERESEGAAYASNFVMRSTMVMNGRGVFVVTAVGDKTQIGNVAISSAEKTDVETPLNLQLNRLGRFINRWGTGLSVLAFVLFLGHDILVNSLWHSTDYMSMAEVVLKYFMMAVTLIVMAVPEGLPMAVTLSLALNMRRMLKSNNLVRKLHACETMGATTVICTDKTGTLTQNQMKVSDDGCWVMGVGYMSQRYDSSGNHLTSGNQHLAEGIAVNSTANIGPDGKGIGNPTEAALLLWLREQGADYADIRRNAEIISQEPFSTETKQMLTTIHIATGEEITYIKGAPEIIMAQCDLSDEERREVEGVLKGYQQKAMRTLALAVHCSVSIPNPARLCRFHSVSGEKTPNTQHPFRLQAVFGISDPIREDVPAAVQQCHDAGIEVKIVTGDVSATAMEIARQIGVVSCDASQNEAITGAEFMALSDEEALERVKYIKVMSRARPQDKQRLVQMLQKRGEVVAVTGDGTNDAPALNYAHVGLSLGSGTNVAKEASDMTLLDDSFASIAKAVMWGRSLYKNLQRFLFFQLVVNVAALLLVIAGSLVGTEMPLTITQILWVNLIMDTFAAMALASLPPSREVMKEKPRKKTDFILTPSIVKGILVTGIIMFIGMFVFLLYCERGIDFGTADTNKAGIDIHELTWFFTTFVMLQWWNLFNAKAIGSHHSAFRRLYADRGLLLVLLLTLVGQWVIVTFGGEMFRCQPLSMTEWLTIILATSPILWGGELYRIYVKRWKKPIMGPSMVFTPPSVPPLSGDRNPMIGKTVEK